MTAKVMAVIRPDVDSLAYQIMANILLVIGAIVCLLAMWSGPRDQNGLAAIVLLLAVVLALGTRFSTVCIYLLGVADLSAFLRFFI
jgi:hypothetical protein